MIKEVIKKDGRVEDFSPHKLNKWAEWASKTLGEYVDWSSVVLDTVSACPERISSRALQERLIKTCLDYNSWSYNRMAGRLYVPLMYSDIFDSSLPKVRELHTKLQQLGLMVTLDYTDEEYEYIESIINHKLDFKEPHYALTQVVKKYALSNKITKQIYETPQFVYMRMAMALAEDQPKERRLQDLERWYYHFSNKHINVPTPNYVNLGTPHKGFASCCAYMVADDVNSLAIGDHIAYMFTANSAGIGSYLQTRSLKDPVRGGLIDHQGKLPYYRALGGAIKANLQSGRGGACTTYFSAFDPEIRDLTVLKNPMTPEDKKIRTLDYALQNNKFFAKKVARNEDIFLFNTFTAPDLVEALFESSEKFEEIYNKYEQDTSFKKIYRSARDILVNYWNEGIETGRGYLFQADEINRHTPHKDKIYSSNLCVAPETRILTRNGYEVISELEGETLDVWNGEEWSNVTVNKTGTEQKLLKVKTNCGYELDCTPYHKFYIAMRNPNSGNRWVIEKRANELKAGDKLIKFNLPVIEGDEELPHAYANGFYSGDGCLTKNGKVIYLYHEKRKLKPVFGDIFTWWSVQENQNREYGKSDVLKDKFFVPSNDYSIQSRLDWFAGLCDSDGTIARNGKTQSIQVGSVNHEFLLDTQMMLQTLGISSKVTKNQEAGLRKMPANDGTGEYKDFMCKETYRLLIGQYGICQLKSLGFTTYRLEITDHVPNRECTQFIKIEEVIDEGRVDDTYCFNEPKRHMGMFNGLLTGQCLELAQPTKPYYDMKTLYSEEEQHDSEVTMCSLAALNVGFIKNDKEYEEAAYYALLMIDKCIHMSHYPLPNVGVTAKARINAGVGLGGVAHYMAKRGAYYSTPRGKEILHELAERHAYYVISASLKLGKELGNAPWMYKTKWPEGWLPIDTYNKNVDNIVKPVYNYDWETLRQDIISNKGIRNSSLMNHMPAESSSKASGTSNGLYPVRELSLIKTDKNNVVYWCAPDGEKLASKYEIFWDQSIKDQLDTYAIIQKFTDQTISADLAYKISGDDKVKSSEIIKDYLYMVKMGVKTKYYTNSKTTSKDICESCSI